jgi:hypothetical protein
MQASYGWERVEKRSGGAGRAKVGKTEGKRQHFMANSACGGRIARGFEIGRTKRLFAGKKIAHCNNGAGKPAILASISGSGRPRALGLPYAGRIPVAKIGRKAFWAFPLPFATNVCFARASILAGKLRTLRSCALREMPAGRLLKGIRKRAGNAKAASAVMAGRRFWHHISQTKDRDPGSANPSRMEYVKLFGKLHECGIRYLICGGLAVNIYGIPRMTADIDILIDFEESNVARCEEALETLAFAPLIPVKLRSLLDQAVREQLIQQKNLIAYSYYNTRSNFMHVDILIDVPLRFDEMWQAKERRELDGIPIYIVSLPHLIDMKRYANRTQDVQDILMLEKLQRLSFD